MNVDAPPLADVPSVPAPSVSAERLLACYRTMVVARAFTDRLRKLAVEGDACWVPSLAGAEAAVLGPLLALDDADVFFGRARDAVVSLGRGGSLAALAHQAFGTAGDISKGRRTPGHISDRARGIVTIGAGAASHLPHAVGYAWAAAQHGESLVTVATFEGPEVDAEGFHAGVNFAGVLKAPTVFLCRARPGEPSAAARGVSYGVESARCDGTDLLAVAATVMDAVARARAGDGPTLVDLVLEGDGALGRTREHLEGQGPGPRPTSGAFSRRPLAGSRTRCGWRRPCRRRRWGPWCRTSIGTCPFTWLRGANEDVVGDRSA